MKDFHKTLIKQLKRHEGTRSKVYNDTTGHRTIGIGFNLERTDARRKLNEVGANFDHVIDGSYELDNEQMNKLLLGDILAVEKDITTVIPCYHELNEVRQRVVLDMAYNIGYITLSNFLMTIGFICEDNYKEASINMGRSLWAKQVGKRALTLRLMMESGEDPKWLRDK
jgi:GH24 family phage-related lysozyme (muramidase)